MVAVAPVRPALVRSPHAACTQVTAKNISSTHDWWHRPRACAWRATNNDPCSSHLISGLERSGRSSTRSAAAARAPTRLCSWRGSPESSPPRRSPRRETNRASTRLCLPRRGTSGRSGRYWPSQATRRGTASAACADTACRPPRRLACSPRDKSGTSQPRKQEPWLCVQRGRGARRSERRPSRRPSEEQFRRQKRCFARLHGAVESTAEPAALRWNRRAAVSAFCEISWQQQSPS